MRCLYCGKELALFKRLTGGAEFCTEAHRKQYQEEYNNLALSRLLHAPPVPEAKPLVPEPPPPTPVPEPTPSFTPAQPAQEASAVPDPVREMLGYLVESPVIWAPAAAAVVGGEPSLLDSLSPKFPVREVYIERDLRDHELRWANPIAWNPPLEASSVPPQPRERNIDARDFARTAAPPSLSLEQSLNPVNETNIQQTITNTLGEPMEIANQPRPPASANIWHGGALSLPVMEPLLGDLARLSFAAQGTLVLGADAPPENYVPPQAAPVPPEPVAPVKAATPEPPPPPAHTEAVQVTLQALGSQPAAPASPVALHLPAVVEPRNPEPSALPLRPTVVLGPSTKPAPAADPVASIAKTGAPPKPQSLKRRTDVRIVPVQPKANPPKPTVETKPVVPAPKVEAPPAAPPAPPVVAKAPVAPPPSKPEPVKMPAPKPAPEVKPAPKPAPEPVAEAAPKPAAAPEPKPTPSKHTTTRSTLIAPEVSSEHKPLATSGVADIGLPPLHAVEEQSFLKKMPLPLKLGMAAVIVLAVGGLVYTSFTGSNATAKTPAVEVEPVYEVGRPINTGGWVEDWAPKDPNRRITLVRGSEPYSNYRFDFRAQIDAKAVGWMFRALNQRNFFVAKLEKLTNGLEPKVQFVRYAVIDGRNEAPVKKELPMKVRVDTNYKVRFEAVGPKFTVWVLGEKIDEWKDARLGSGGVGFYSENGEFAALQGNVSLFELVEKKN